MDLRKVKSLIDLVSESDISELEISEGPDKVKIVKSSRAIKETHIGKREEIRHTSFIAGVADSIISGCGHYGYIYGFQFLLQKINGPEKS